jgi:cyclophilin family peptidyl-prolyl cis-trans isomerase/HEAT repeat protein
MVGRCLTVIVLTVATAAPRAQTITNARVAILLAGERGARDARDLATLRAGVRNTDSETARAAIRELGRLGRPSLLPDIAVALKSPFPEVRAEAADAMASALAASSTAPKPSPAARASSTAASSAATAVSSGLSTLLARLAVEDEPGVRAAICEALGRLPLTDVVQMTKVETALVARARTDSVADRLGAVKGLESLLRITAGQFIPSPSTTMVLRDLVGVAAATSDSSLSPPRDARIRRLALQALMTTGAIDDAVVSRAAADSDPQVRWLAMRAAGTVRGLMPGLVENIISRGMDDSQPMVRREALLGEELREKGRPMGCRSFMAASSDSNMSVALLALDLLGNCGASPEAVALLDYTASNLSDAGSPRGWQRAAHALVALARSAPEQGSSVLDRFTGSSNAWLRRSAAQAAAILHDRATLKKLSADPDEHVARIARAELGSTALPEPSPASSGRGSLPQSTDLNAADLQRFAAPRARVTIRGVGIFELALFTYEAPATVLRFIRLVQAGHYDGATLEASPSPVLNLIPAASDGPADRREIGPWPHVRGTLGLAGGDEAPDGAAVFIDLVDNPQFDHRYPVFAQVLNGTEILDEILEGDVIERIEIVPGS